MVPQGGFKEHLVDTGVAMVNSSMSARRTFSSSQGSGEMRRSGDEEDLVEATAGDSGFAKQIPELDGGVGPLPFGVVQLSEQEVDRLEATAGDSGSTERMTLDNAAASRAPASGHGRVAQEDYAFSPSPVLFPGSHGLSDWSCGPSPGPDGNELDDPHVEMGGAGLSRAQQERMFQRASQELALQSASKAGLPPTVEHMSALSHLAVFGMLGVLIRYGLEVLFGPAFAGSADHGVFFLDLPANMVGSFFMGWVGAIFKKDIALFSELLAVGLSTGLMGSITTYASWNQRMLAIATEGHWVQAICGLVFGMQLSLASLITGMSSAKGFLALLQSVQHRRVKRGLPKLQTPVAEDLVRRWKSFWLFVSLAAGMWIAALLLSLVHISHIARRRLWLACAVAPPGVWTRWYLARLNGRGLGSKHRLKWLPVGTLSANLIASLLESGLSTVQLAANEEHATVLIGALQLGLLGCMSTVSTFVLEVHTMHQFDKNWRAEVYVTISVACSFLLGIMTYSIPVWVLRLTSRYNNHF